MKYLLPLLLAFSAHADITVTNSNDNLRSPDGITTTSTQVNSQVASSISRGGHASSNIHPGAVHNQIGATASTEGGDASSDISIRDENPRQAPSVGLVVPSSTAECMKGIGFGGSRSTGSMLMGWSWLARDCHALKQFELLASLGLYTPAAHAYCDRNLHRANFDSLDQCRAMIIQSLIDAAEPDRTAEYEALLKEREAELSALQERFERLESEVGGGGKKLPAASG